jgi:hypothetical protein
MLTDEKIARILSEALSDLTPYELQLFSHADSHRSKRGQQAMGGVPSIMGKDQKAAKRL